MNPPPGKRLLVVTEVFYPEEFLINDLVFAWKEEGRDVTVLTRSPSYPAGVLFPGYRNRLCTRDTVKGIPVIRVQFIPGYRNRTSVKILNYLWNMVLAMLWVAMHGRKYDHVFICQTGPLTFAAAGSLFRRWFGKRAVIWTQDVWPHTVHAYGLAKRGLTRRLLEVFVRWVYHGCDHVAVTSPGYCPLLAPYTTGRPVEFIPQWSLTPPDSEAPGRTPVQLPGRFNFLFAGNLGKVQNLDNLTEGFGRFLSRSGHDDTWLCLAGDGSHLPALKEKVRGMNLRNIYFPGRVPLSEIPAWYEAADVLVISLDDTPVFRSVIPAKFQSGLSAAKPIYAVIAGEVERLVTEHDLGWTADPADPDAIADGFEQIVSASREVLSRKAANCRSLLSGQFSRRALIRRITARVFD